MSLSGLWYSKDRARKTSPCVDIIFHHPRASQQKHVNFTPNGNDKRWPKQYKDYRERGFRSTTYQWCKGIREQGFRSVTFQWYWAIKNEVLDQLHSSHVKSIESKVLDLLHDLEYVKARLLTPLSGICYVTTFILKGRKGRPNSGNEHPSGMYIGGGEGHWINKFALKDQFWKEGCGIQIKELAPVIHPNERVSSGHQ